MMFKKMSIEVKFYLNLIDTTKVVNQDNYYNKLFQNKNFLSMHFTEY